MAAALIILASLTNSVLLLVLAIIAAILGVLKWW
jgi:hypothetical protein